MGDDSQNNQHSHPYQHSQDNLHYGSQSVPRITTTNMKNIDNNHQQTDDEYHQQAVNDGQQQQNEGETLTNMVSSNQTPLPSLPTLKHWTEVLYEVKGVNLEEYNIAGGSDYGQLPYLMESGDILLEVNDHRVAGYTRNDVIDVVKSKPVVDIKAVSSSSSFGLPIDLREYLSRPAHRTKQRQLIRTVCWSINKLVTTIRRIFLASFRIFIPVAEDIHP